MEGLIITAFVFCMVGVIALMRIEKVIKILKEKGILEENFRSYLWKIYVVLIRRNQKLIGTLKEKGILEVHYKDE